MSKEVFVRSYRLIFGLTIIAAVITQFLTFKQSPVNFFSYFTVLSNLMVSAVFLYVFLTGKSIDKLRGAGLLYVLLTGTGFIFLLGGKNNEFIDWVNIVLHYLSPTVVLLDWIFIRSKKITFKQSLSWLLFLIVFLIYSLIRGGITGWYPYGFLNASEVGYLGVAKYSAILALGSVMLSWVIVRLTSKDL